MYERPFPSLPVQRLSGHSPYLPVQRLCDYSPVCPFRPCLAIPRTCSFRGHLTIPRTSPFRACVTISRTCPSNGHSVWPFRFCPFSALPRPIHHPSYPPAWSIRSLRRVTDSGSDRPRWCHGGKADRAEYVPSLPAQTAAPAVTSPRAVLSGDPMTPGHGSRSGRRIQMLMKPRPGSVLTRLPAQHAG